MYLRGKAIQVFDVEAGFQTSSGQATLWIVGYPEVIPQPRSRNDRSEPLRYLDDEPGSEIALKFHAFPPKPTT
jgi:hypothetical protein